MEFSSTLRFPPHINESESPVTILSSSILSFAGTATSPAFPHSIVSALAVNSAGFTLLTLPPAAPDGHLSLIIYPQLQIIFPGLYPQKLHILHPLCGKILRLQPFTGMNKKSPIPAFLNPSICSPQILPLKPVIPPPERSTPILLRRILNQSLYLIQCAHPYVLLL